ncbi:gamma-glutamyltranspeptidase [Halteromyces radiatus]|uniref:gamma-glutamyltranspeptidase n=1 Tax=Halteromyces radiatus TaxID=101107 RepID=UPI00221F0844|nr:gamma-glutamyltranspeptidase [Halteromyces radiatus]KAI8089276.1 gamma-glutamyltranspeptidase [Halteromyces radiatus]
MPPLHFIGRRSAVYSTHAMVSSSQPSATQAGIEVLKKGGNAADAAVAVAAALGVTEPSSTGIGGDAFCLFYDAKTKTVKGLNGSGRTPANLTLDIIRKEGIEGQGLPSKSIHAVTVPGAAAAWADCVEWFGSGKLDLATVLKPAIDLAENGFPVAEVSSHLWKAQQQDLIDLNPGQQIEYLIDGLRAPDEGDIMTLPTLAKSYKVLAHQGKAEFYQGYIGQAIVDAVQNRGGVLTMEDLAIHSSQPVEPISIDYHDHTVWEIPPNGQGITALMALGIIEALEKNGSVDFTQLEHNSAAYLHVVIEALRLAFADTRYYVGDPDVVHVPIQELLSKEYLAERAKLIDLKHRNGNIQKGYPEKMGNTVYFSVVDEEGNACSFINSTFMAFGSNIIPESCGFPLHNRGCNFVLIEDHPNCIAPSKRPYHTIIPSMITKKQDNGDHEFEACFGVMGAFAQPQGQVQVILNMLRYLQNPQHSLDLPRICVAPPAPQDKNKKLDANAYSFTDVSQSVVYLEDGITTQAIQELETMGHTCIQLVGHARSMMGRGQVIRSKYDQRTGKRVLVAGSDPRGDGHAEGW